MSGPELLREWRERSGLSQAAAGELLATTQTRVSEYESGRIRPGLDTALRIWRETGIPPEAWGK